MKKKSFLAALLFAGLIIPLAGCAKHVSAISANVPSKMTVGDVVDLKVGIEPDNAAEQDYSFKVSDEKVLKIEDLKLTAVGAGTASVTLTSAFAGIAPVVYNVEVSHLLPTAFEANIPEKITTLDEVELKVTVTPTNASYKDFVVESSDDNVITYNTVSKKLIPLAPGDAQITIKMPLANLTKTYNIHVDKGYAPLANFTEFKEFIKDRAPIWNKQVSDAKIDHQVHSYNNGVYTIDSETSYYKFADKGISVERYGTVDEQETSTLEYHAIEGDKYYDLISNERAYIKTITSYVESPNFEITEEDAIKDIYSKNIIKEILEALDNSDLNISFKEGDYKSQMLDNGTFDANLTIENTDTNTPKKYSLKVNVGKTGELWEAKLSTDTYATPTGEDRFETLLRQDQYYYHFSNNEKYTVDTLDNKDKGIYFATSFKAEYQPNSEKAANVDYVGGTLNTQPRAFNFTEVNPKTAANLTDINVFVIEGLGTVIEKSGTYLSPTYKFVAPGTAKIKVKPVFTIAGEPEPESIITLEVKYPDATNFEYAKIVGDKLSLKVGEVGIVDAKIAPKHADQHYTVSTTSDKVTVNKNESGKWEVKGIAPTSEQEVVTLDVVADSNKNIKTAIKLSIIGDEPVVNPESPVGAYKGRMHNDTFNINGTKAKIVINPDLSGSVITLPEETKMGDFVKKEFNEQTGELNIKFTGAGDYVDEDLTWKYDKNTQKLSGKVNFNNFDSAFTLSFNFDKYNPVDPSGVYIGKASTGMTLKITLNKDYTGSVADNFDGQLLGNFIGHFDEETGKLTIEFSPNPATSWEGKTYDWQYDKNTKKLSGSLYFNESDGPFNMNFDIPLYVPVDLSGVYVGKTSIGITFKITLSKDITGQIIDNYDDTFVASFKGQYDEAAGKIKIKILKVGPVWSEGDYTWKYDKENKKISGFITFDDGECQKPANFEAVLKK